MKPRTTGSRVKVPLLIALAIGIVVGYVTKDWTTGITVGLALAGLGGAGIAGLTKMSNRRTMPGTGTEQPDQPSQGPGKGKFSGPTSDL